MRDGTAQLDRIGWGYRTTEKEGGIVTGPRDRMSLGQGDIVYLDLGSAQGVLSKDRFTVFGPPVKHLEGPAEVVPPEGKKISRNWSL